MFYFFTIKFCPRRLVKVKEAASYYLTYVNIVTIAALCGGVTVGHALHRCLLTYVFNPHGNPLE